VWRILKDLDKWPTTGAVAQRGRWRRRRLRERIGVFEVNLGTPDLSVLFRRAALPFVSSWATGRHQHLAMDLATVALRSRLAFRPMRTARNYRKIWMQEGSPLAVHSGRLAAQVGAVLKARLGDGIRVELGMTYGNPSLAGAVTALQEQNAKKLLVLPCIRNTAPRRRVRYRWDRQRFCSAGAGFPRPASSTIITGDPGYIGALTGSIESALEAGRRALASDFSYQDTRGLCQGGRSISSPGGGDHPVGRCAAGFGSGRLLALLSVPLGSVAWLQALHRGIP